jgi:hypothetical protein
METQKPVPYFITGCIIIIAIFIGLLTFNSYHDGNQKITIPKERIVVMITAEQNQSSAIDKAVDTVGEAVIAQCGWSEQKLQNGDYDQYAKMNVWVTKEKVEAQAEVQKSVCPEK